MRNHTKRRALALPIAGSLAIAVLLSGCNNAREAFGLGKTSPDEFAVVTRAPLSMPPDFGLRPPKPGVKRPQEIAVKDQARKILVQSGIGAGVAGGSEDLSRGENALLSKAGASSVDPSIRQTVSRENSVLLASDPSLIDRLMFWREAETKFSLLDPTLEARRLRENSALGDTVTKGATPVIERKERGLLEGLFN